MFIWSLISPWCNIRSCLMSIHLLYRLQQRPFMRSIKFYLDLPLLCNSASSLSSRHLQQVLHFLWFEKLILKHRDTIIGSFHALQEPNYCNYYHHLITTQASIVNEVIHVFIRVFSSLGIWFSWCLSGKSNHHILKARKDLKWSCWQFWVA